MKRQLKEMIEAAKAVEKNQMKIQYGRHCCIFISLFRETRENNGKLIGFRNKNLLPPITPPTVLSLRDPQTLGE